MMVMVTQSVAFLSNKFESVTFRALLYKSKVLNH